MSGRRGRGRIAIGLLAAAAATLSCDEPLVYDPPEGFEDVVLVELVLPDTLVIGAVGSAAVALRSEATGATVVAGGPAVQWLSSDTTVLRVTAAAGDSVDVVARGLGEATLTATIDGRPYRTQSIESVVEVVLAGVRALAPDTSLGSLGDTIIVAGRGIGVNAVDVAVSGLAWEHHGAGAVTMDTLAGSDEVRLIASAPGTDTIVVRHGRCASECADTVVVEVEQVPASIALSEDSIRMIAIGERRMLEAQVFDARGNAIVGVAPSFALEDNADSTITTVEASGGITATGNGVTRVVTSYADVSAEAVVEVMQAVARVRLAPDTIDFRALGRMDTLSATPEDTAGHVIEWSYVVDWSVDGAAVASSAVGDRLEVSAMELGTGSVTATVDTVAGVGVVFVSPAAMTLASESDTLIAIGQELGVAATALDSAGTPLAAIFVWRSLDADVASVDASGVVTSLQNGTARIEARIGAEADTATILVEQDVRAVQVTPTTETVLRQDSLPLVVTALDSLGVVVVDAQVSYTTSDSSVARVGVDGVVVAQQRPGVAIITADADGVEAMVTLTVSPRMVARATDFGCLLDDDGDVWCWGGNAAGQLGIGSSDNEAHPYPEPVVMPPGEDFVQIDALVAHVCGLTSSAKLYCWGQGWSGSIGDGGFGDRHLPTQVSLPAGEIPVQVTTGDAFTCMVAESGNAFCWGRNDWGQLGNGGTADVAVPTQVALAGIAVQSMDAGVHHACAITMDGTYCWGENSEGQLGDGTTQSRTSPVPVQAPAGEVFRAVQTFDQHTCALTATGDAYCWGDNGSGELGDNSTTNRLVPVAVWGEHRFRSLLLEWDRSCGVASDHGLYCWGNNGEGQFGNSTGTSSLIPVRAGGSLAFHSASGAGHGACGLSFDGAAYCWGDRNLGAVGDGVAGYTAIHEQTIGSFIDVAAAGNHTCGLKSDGSVECWGRNQSNQLGTGTPSYRSLSPVDVELPSGVSLTAIDGGWGEQTCGIDGGTRSVYCWGSNWRGALGDDGASNNETVEALLAEPVTRLSVGGWLTCAIGDSQVLYCWGHNDNGEVGDGTTSDRSTPVAIGGSLRFIEVAAGLEHACAIDTSARVRCWGENGYGEVGAAASSEPAPVEGLTGSFVQVAVGLQHSCAIQTSGVMYCWGHNAQGQLGSGGQGESSPPVQVQGSGWVDVTMGHWHTCATTATEFYCWGSNYQGQMGLGHMGGHHLTPQPLPGMQPSTIDASHAYTCVTSAGDISCWGDRSHGALGDGQARWAIAPHRVIGLP